MIRFLNGFCSIYLLQRYSRVAKIRIFAVLTPNPFRYDFCSIFDARKRQEKGSGKLPVLEPSGSGGEGGAKLAFNKSISAITKVKDQVGFQAVAVVIVGEPAAEVLGIGPEISCTHVLKDEAEGFKLSLQRLRILQFYRISHIFGLTCKPPYLSSNDK